MEIPTLLVGTSFGALLASLAVAPNLLRIFLQSRSEKKIEAIRHRAVAFSGPTPFNYPEMFVNEGDARKKDR